MLQKTVLDDTGIFSHELIINSWVAPKMNQAIGPGTSSSQAKEIFRKLSILSSQFLLSLAVLLDCLRHSRRTYRRFVLIPQ